MEHGCPGGGSPRSEDLVSYARRLCEERLAAYVAAPHDAEEHAGVEMAVLAGGYAYRQIAELVQNAADAVADAAPSGGVARIEVRLDEAGLWVANTGQPVDAGGVLALLNANTSGKRANQIGRFGLGFKSLLKLGGCIDVISRGIWLHFDPNACRQRILEHLALPPGSRAPGLRLADAGTWSDGLGRVIGSPALSWASTIVFAEAAQPGARDAIVEEMRSFPAEFLLFLPCDVELDLHAAGMTRRLRRVSMPDGSVAVEDKADLRRGSQTWRVFQAAVNVNDPAALQDATAIHGRASIPMIWAAPIGGGRDVSGRFFAFLPTSSETRTLGILNAPWKLNSDRTAIIPGAWNNALIEAAAELMVASLPALATDADPGAILDAFPREAQSGEPAYPLVEALWRHLLHAHVVPNCDGMLMKGEDLLRPPVDSAELVLAWSRLADQPACERQVHSSCVASPHRAARLAQLAARLAASRGGGSEVAHLRRQDASGWLEAAATSDPEDAHEVILLAGMLADLVPATVWNDVRDRCRILLNFSGTLTSAPELILSAASIGPLQSVHPLIASNPAAAALLRERFRLGGGTGGDWRRLLESRMEEAEVQEDWGIVWSLLRLMPAMELETVIDRKAIAVKTLNGWQLPGQVFRLGPLMTRDDVEILDVYVRPHIMGILLDDEFHIEDDGILAVLGVGFKPPFAWVPVSSMPGDLDPDARWYRTWHDQRIARYLSSLPGRPTPESVGATGVRMPAAWHLLLHVEGHARARVTRHLLDVVQTRQMDLTRVRFQHLSRSNLYRAETFAHPLCDLLTGRGRIANEGAHIALGTLLHRDVFPLVEVLPSVQPVIDGLRLLAEAGASADGAAAVEEVWRVLVQFVAYELVSAHKLGALWATAAAAGVRPFEIPTEHGPVPISVVRIARCNRDAAIARDAGLTSLALDPETRRIWLAGGAIPLEEDMRFDWRPLGCGSEMIPLLDLDPVLETILRTEASREAAVTLASDLNCHLLTRTVPVDWALTGGRLIILQSALVSAGDDGRTRILVEAAEAAGWTVDGELLERALGAGVSVRRRKVAHEKDLPNRLLRAIGDAGILQSLFENDIWLQLSQDTLRLATVALTLFGPSLLSLPQIRAAMDRNGLEPPERWGGDQAAAFVTAIGFPLDYAIAPARRREAEIVVGGPMPLKPLHDFQEKVLERVDELLIDTAARRRAVISLPTGAGKTRVAGQAAVTRILVPERDSRMVLWIAQSEELCEQAVQCFRELWANVGARGVPLRIVRFWGGTPSPRPSNKFEPTVVVASIQQLISRMGDTKLRWMSQPGLVVIDECHHAIGRSYSDVLRWLHQDLAQGEREPPVLGLSATPFRGRNEDETRLLANRFEGRLLPEDQAELFECLQARGVLARFEYTRLDMEHRFCLTAQEEERVRMFGTLPESAMERLGEDRDRNDRILKAVAASKPRSTLIFATSVAHAHRLAANLNVMGIPAASVSGVTDQSARRWFINSFQKGDICVLCNHSALTTGFDAPATDLVVIARPVFSPALYMQMVGRGLRGPANGGTDVCKILTIQDNIEQYTNRLAHHYFEKYYT